MEDANSPKPLGLGELEEQGQHRSDVVEPEPVFGISLASDESRLVSVASRRHPDRAGGSSIRSRSADAHPKHSLQIYNPSEADSIKNIFDVVEARLEMSGKSVQESPETDGTTQGLPVYKQQPPYIPPTYSKVHRSHVDIESLKYFGLPWEYDVRTYSSPLYHSAIYYADYSTD